jgi:hypothetical protein
MEQDMDWLFRSIPGAKEFSDWFEGWPNFADSEIVDVYFRREADSRLNIHTWKASLDEASHKFIAYKHVVVSIIFQK